MPMLQRRQKCLVLGVGGAAGELPAIAGRQSERLAGVIVGQGSLAVGIRRLGLE
ncbi:MAG: hypothetical protein H6Q38_2359 [Chloroflexi bacterium]|jgi:hypothetical protein|nr:hypothetical protein [Chloroflexota bacterium]